MSAQVDVGVFRADEAQLVGIAASRFTVHLNATEDGGGGAGRGGGEAMHVATGRLWVGSFRGRGCGIEKIVIVCDALCVCVLHIKPFFYSSTSSTPSVRTDYSP